MLSFCSANEESECESQVQDPGPDQEELQVQDRDQDEIGVSRLKWITGSVTITTISFTITL
jgi:hypothetical protein